MGLLSGWFRKNKSEDYDQVLAALSLDIQKRQTRLSEIRLRERRSTLLFSVYALASWVAYVSLWYTGYVPSLSGRPRGSGVEKFAEGVPVFLGPIVILFIRRIVQIWYTRIGDGEEKHLVTLRKQQRDKIEEIKKKTNYYSTRNLIERYDEASQANGAADSPLRRRMPGGVSVPATPQRPVQSPPHPQPQPQLVIPQTPVSANGQIPPGLQQHLSPSPQRPMPPPRKQWYDKLADAILGDDDTSGSGAASRYALICQKCFGHNGLVKESVWEVTQYVCPKCGHFNPSPASQRKARASASHRSSTSPPPTSAGTGALAPPLEQPVGIDRGPNVSSRMRSTSRHNDQPVQDDAPTVLMEVDADS